MAGGDNTSYTLNDLRGFRFSADNVCLPFLRTAGAARTKQRPKILQNLLVVISKVRASLFKLKEQNVFKSRKSIIFYISSPKHSVAAA